MNSQPPRVIARADHPISRKDIDPDTLRVLYKLKDAGYESYLVGGAVRDLLMGRRPKDFDIATDARPNDLRRLFRNSRVVGKRFKLVHVFFGQKNVEVATLRSAATATGGEGDLYIDDDNQWGDLESDAFRRDFTINALFYDIRDFAVIDYTGGVQDLEDRLVATIGDPRVRFQEDPVRMLRALKFAARFGYDIEAETDAALRELSGEILKASRFRVTEEIFRILTQANRETGLRLLHRYGLLAVLYPEWLEVLGEDGFEQVCDYFSAVDRAAAEDRHYPLEILAAGLFLPLLGSVDLEKDHFNRVAARVTGEVRTLGLRMDLPKRLVNNVAELLRGQLYLLFFHHLSKRVRRFVESDWFDAAWRVHELAYGGVAELVAVQEVWLKARQALRRPMGGIVGGPDRRDIFSFRGRTGGGRLGRGGRGGDDDEDGDMPGIIADPRDDEEDDGDDEDWPENALETDVDDTGEDDEDDDAGAPGNGAAADGGAAADASAGG
jgi:poly(A) polymerase